MRRALTAFSVAAAIGLSAGPGLAQDRPAIPVHVGGRVVHDPDGGLSFGWPGVYFEGRFRGTGVRVRFEAVTEIMRVVIDGRERAVFRQPGLVDAAFDGLTPGEHVVRLEKLSESQTGGGRFIGFTPTGDGVPLPVVLRARQIEFIGDSYTVGYGNTARGRVCTADEIHALTDTQSAFGPVVARHYDADYRINAYSGFGVVRNYNGGVPTSSLPAIYGRLKPDAGDMAQAQADDGWRPQVIVINLGTNDFSTPLNPGEAWTDDAGLRAAYRARYLGFVRDIAQAQPQARFVLMGSDAFIADVQGIAADLNARTPGLASTVRFEALELNGCDYHPSLPDEATLAALVEGAVDRLDDPWREGAAR